MRKLDLDVLKSVSGGGGSSYNNSASNGGVSIQGDNNTVNYGNTSNQSSNSGSSKKS